MKQLFLTSSIGTPGVAASIIAKLKDLKGFRTAFITTPVETKGEAADLEWLQEDRKAMVVAGFDLFDYTITGKSIDQITLDLSNVDIIYMSGGNTNYLLDQSQQTGFLQFVKEFVDSGKPYISTSAGSIITGPVIPPYMWGDEKDQRKLESFAGYNFVNFTVIPHWGSPHFADKYLKGRMEQIYSDKNQSFILVNDNQYVEVKDDWHQIVDVTQK